MQQPSAQGIASLFRGNPAPLQQRIQQEQQGKPGLPPDLQKLLALNIVTNEKDAVAKQQAMNQLAQMQGPQGKPPTVMESVQEQARQKMQAQAMQAQRQQQAMQAMAQQAGPGPVPEGTQFAEAQPSAQGIDELPVEFGLAGGGIVAFQEGKKVPRIQDEASISDEERQRLEQELLMRIMGEEARNPPAPKRPPMEITESDLSSIPGMERSDLMARELRKNEPKPQSEYGRQMGEVGNLIGRGAKAVGRAIDKVVPDPIELVKTLVSAPGSASPFAVKEAAPQAAPAQAAASYSNEGRTGARPYTPKPVSDLKALAEADARKKQAARPPAPVAQPAPAPVAAAPEAAPVQESQAAKLLSNRLNVDPMAERLAEQERRRREIGDLDTSTHDRMIAELEKRKAQLEGPKDSFGQLMEYLGHIAATPRGMSSFEAGAAGAANLRKAEKARQLEQFDLSKQALEVSQKKIDAVRAFATEQYNVGKSRFDQVYKEQFEAAKEITKDEGDARRLAQENTLKRLELDQQAQLDREKMANQLKVANINQTREYNEQARNQQYLNLSERARRLREAGDTAGADRVQAQANDILTLKGSTGTAGVGVGRNKIMERRQSMAELEKIIKDEGMVYSDADKASAAREYRRLAMLNVQEGEGGATGGGKPITKAEYDKLPKGATYTAPDGTQRTKG